MDGTATGAEARVSAAEAGGALLWGPVSTSRARRAVWFTRFVGRAAALVIPTRAAAVLACLIDGWGFLAVIVADAGLGEDVFHVLLHAGNVAEMFAGARELAAIRKLDHPRVHAVADKLAAVQPFSFIQSVWRIS